MCVNTDSHPVSVRDPTHDGYESSSTRISVTTDVGFLDKVDAEVIKDRVIHLQRTKTVEQLSYELAERQLREDENSAKEVNISRIRRDAKNEHRNLQAKHKEEIDELKKSRLVKDKEGFEAELMLEGMVHRLAGTAEYLLRLGEQLKKERFGANSSEDHLKTLERVAGVIQDFEDFHDMKDFIVPDDETLDDGSGSVTDEADHEEVDDRIDSIDDMFGRGYTTETPDDEVPSPPPVLSMGAQSKFPRQRMPRDSSLLTFGAKPKPAVPQRKPAGSRTIKAGSKTADQLSKPASVVDKAVVTGNVVTQRQVRPSQTLAAKAPAKASPPLTQHSVEEIAALKAKLKGSAYREAPTTQPTATTPQNDVNAPIEYSSDEENQPPGGAPKPFPKTAPMTPIEHSGLASILKSIQP